MACIAGVTLLVAWFQLNAWRRQQIYQKTADTLEIIRSDLWRLKDELLTIKIFDEYSRRWPDGDLVAGRDLGKEIENLRPLVNSLEVNRARYAAYASPGILYQAIERARMIWEKELSHRVFSSLLIGIAAQLGEPNPLSGPSVGDDLEAALGMKRSEVDRLQVAREAALADPVIAELELSLADVHKLLGDTARGKAV